MMMVSVACGDVEDASMLAAPRVYGLWVAVVELWIEEEIQKERGRLERRTIW